MGNQTEAAELRRLTFHAPEGFKSGREVGAWAYGIACGKYPEAGDEVEQIELLVALKAEYVDGAACAIVAAGGAVSRAKETQYPLADGEACLTVAIVD